jgi:alanine racemase
MDNFRPVWAEVNLAALKRNLQRIKQYTDSEIMPIVKANAYGHGAVEVVGALREEGIKRFGVAFLEEALVLRQYYPDFKANFLAFSSLSKSFGGEAPGACFCFANLSRTSISFK